MIDDPQAIKFVNENIRPMCEITEDLVASISTLTTAWFGGLNLLFPNDGTLVDDGREAEGVSRLTGANINSVMGILIAIGNASNSEIINKPTVRSPIVRR
jgi:hypothetical protein